MILTVFSFRFIAYKTPKVSKAQAKKYKLSTEDIGKMDGSRYYYMDNSRKEFILSKHSLTRSEFENTAEMSAIQLTLEKSVYAASVPFRMLYNDQPPGERPSKSYGHAKGVVAFDAESGVWLVHSVPRFPNHLRYEYAWPKNALNNGQVFLCMTLNVAAFQEVIIQLLTRQVYAYDTKADKNDVDTILEAIAMRNVELKSDLWEYVLELKYKDVTASKSKKLNALYPSGKVFPRCTSAHTHSGLLVHMHAKNGRARIDLYNWLAKTYGIKHFRVQTWRSGNGGEMRSYCHNSNRYYRSFESRSVAYSIRVENINEIMFDDLTVPIRYTKDHSKWAVGTGAQGVPVLCIGDVNRMVSRVFSCCNSYSTRMNVCDVCARNYVFTHAHKLKIYP